MLAMLSKSPRALHYFTSMSISIDYVGLPLREGAEPLPTLLVLYSTAIYVEERVEGVFPIYTSADWTIFSEFSSFQPKNQ
jgi:hypothetical protein